MRPGHSLLLLVPLAAMLIVTAAHAEELHEGLHVPQRTDSERMRQAARGPGVWVSAARYDTTLIGYDATHAADPGNYWNVWANSRAGAVAGVSCWNFESPGDPGLHGDSLMGWWPTNDRAPVLGSSLSDDHEYVYSCVDFGNATNYKIPGTNARTWGVIGAWHADPGVLAGTGVTWTPMSGGKSAWCGLRQHHDTSVIDTQTHNPYNSDCADFIVQNASATVKNFPGYVRAWDQMLYRDITPVEGEALTLSFLYRTWMSTEYTVGAGRRGWFHGDPLTVADGNFISSFTQNGPIDSFSVYIGVPVDDSSVKLSNGDVAPVYDPQRRWFSEVLRIWDGPGAPYYELLAKTGINPASPDTMGSNLFTGVVPWRAVAAIVHSPLNTSGGNVRLVFRVKTNNTGDDLTSSTWGELGGRGAAQVDDVTLRWGAGPAQVIGDFEGSEGDPGNVNNAIGASPVTYWKATGRPPALLLHATNLAGLPWNDYCGPQGAASLACNMQGNVLDGGIEPTHTLGDPSYEAGKNGIYGILSPTIDLSATGTSLLNSQGLDSTLAGGSDDYYVQFDVQTADLNPFTGAMFFYGCAAYPNRSAGTGTEIWGDVVTSPSIYYDSSPLCQTVLLPFKCRNMVWTSAATGKPDSMRVWLGFYNFPLRFGAGANAHPTDGAYFDNVSFVIVNKTGPNQAGALSSDIWQWFVDAFPVAKTVSLGPGTFASSLDSCGALVKGALNIAPYPPAGGGPRLDVLADTIVVVAPDLTVAAGDTSSRSVRVDMVFRILPGPGNYRANSGDLTPRYPPVAGMKLLRRPDVRNTSAQCLVNPADPADSSFWSAYIRNPGEFSSPSPHPRNEWDYLTWNSARIDTAETNLFPTRNLTSAFPVLVGSWQSTLHESDPHYGMLGFARPRCFVIDTTQYANLQNSNIVCGSAPAWLSPESQGATPPRSRTGWDGTVSTIEGTKVIPDGLLTPGAHVQYFFRKSQVFGQRGFQLDPDTSTISPQVSESSFDGHRWQQFGVLPDRWKDTQYGGAGMACILYLDYDDRRGDELVWASAMDSTCGTSAAKYGAHNGWHAAGTGHSLDKNYNVNLKAEAFTYKNAQPGTTWDMWSARATEAFGSVGSRLGARFATSGTGLLAGKEAATAPTPLMLKQFYSSIALLSGDLNSTVLGPFLGCPEDDIRILGDFLNDTGGLLPKPRSLYLAGSGIVSSEAVDPVHEAFFANQLRTTLVAPSYRELAANSTDCSDLISTSVISSTEVFGMSLSCSFQDDVIAANTLVPGGSNVTQFTNTGAGPYYAGVYHAPDALNPNENYVSLVNSFDLQNLWTRYCIRSVGRVLYANALKSKIFGAVCASWAMPCAIDVPQSPPGIANYLRIGDSVMRSRDATVRFGVATAGRVRVRLYDVAGRLVRTLADRTFPGGEAQTVRWDGRDQVGNAAPRGVYFARIDYASGQPINGRIVLLR